LPTISGMDIEIFFKIGPSKVTAAIHHNSFTQGSPQTPSESWFNKMPDPFDILESMRSTKKEEKSNRQKMSLDKRPMHVEPVKAHVEPVYTEAIQVHDDGYSKCDDTISTNSFAALILYSVDKSLSLLRATDAMVHVERFKKDCAAQLDGERQLYKTFGFARKKTSSIEALKHAFMVPNMDMSLQGKDEVIMYMAKLTNSCIILYNMESGMRNDFNKSSTYLLLVYNKDRYQMYNEIDLGAITIELYRLHVDEFKTNIDSETSFSKLRALGKAVGIKGTNKEEVVTAIRAAIHVEGA
jgi:hypothetical protein